MNRRPLLAALAAALAGCGGYAGADDDGGGNGGDIASEGDDDAPIDASVEELLLADGDLDGDWERQETDEENCREFARSADDQRFVLTSCAWVYDDLAEAESEYEDRVERTHKLSNRGSETDEPPDVGVEATRIDGRGDANVVFRDANAVGSIQLEGINLGVGARFTEVEHGNAVEYAAAMHERWRE